MSEPAQKCENSAIFKQNYTLELFIALEMVHYCCFSLSFITSTTGRIVLWWVLERAISFHDTIRK